MGLKDRFKKAREQREQSTWSINGHRGNIILEDKYVLITIIPNKEHIVFYRDIKRVERRNNFVMVSSVVEDFRIAPLGVRGAEDKAKDLQLSLLDKMSQ